MCRVSPSPVARLGSGSRGCEPWEAVAEAALGSPSAARWPAGSYGGRGGQTGCRAAGRAPGSVKRLSRIYFLQELELAELKKYFAPSMFSDFHTFLDFKGNVIGGCLIHWK